MKFRQPGGGLAKKHRPLSSPASLFFPRGDF
nr:MAG TPA: hypothetical protein [Caudoviricetes sp.]DAR10132.1 MAG TPA: hypothetical protein [Caudoviricetes sp.]